MDSPAFQATRILNFLLQGESVQGARFGSPQILFSSGPDKPLGEPYINLASAWTIYPVLPDKFPGTEEDVPDFSSQADEYNAIVDLRHCIVESVEILQPTPHLVVYFTDGRVLFLSGSNMHYESWQAGQSFSDSENWLVVACPGGDLVAWAPDKFWAGAA